MDELKNLVIQTLETNGILGQIRAKLRSSVFKVIDNNDPSHKEKAMHWENPLAQKVLETTESELAADLIREYLEHYRLDYTLSILIPEANLKQEPMDREGLIKRAEVDRATDKEPLLVQILRERKAGGRPVGSGMVKEEPKSTFLTSSSPPDNVEKMNKYSHNKKDELDFLKKPEGAASRLSPNSSKKKENDSNDYDDDFEDDDIQEDIPANDDEHDPNKFEESGNAFTGSQSMGMDPSVNTLAMDEYDHVEEVNRIG